MKSLFISVIISILPLLGLAQSFEAQWKEVERLIQIKNYAQTQPILSAIKRDAKATGNSPEWIRAILAEHHALTVNMTTDSAFYRVQRHFEEQLSIANKIEKNILNNLYAQFLSRNIFQTRVENTGHFLSWEENRRKSFVDSIFNSSLNDPDLLLKQPIEKWHTLLSHQQNQSLAPTVYHLLVYAYNDFLNSYGSAKEINKNGTLLFNSLQQINKTQGYTNAYAYLLFYPYTHTNLWEIHRQETQIEKLLNDHQSDYNAHILLLLANAWKIHDDNRKAIQYLNKALQDYPTSPWADDVKKLYDELTQASATMEISNFALPNKYTPVKLHARNTDKVFIRVYNITNTPQSYKEYKTQYDSLSHRVNINAPLSYEETVYLKSFDDYNSHITNYKINPLPYGNYKVLIANNPDFLDNGQEYDVSQIDFIVSNIFVSPVIEAEGNHTTDYLYTTLLVNRKTGLPYANENISLYYFEKDKPTQISTLKTDKNGVFNYLADYHKNRYELEDQLLFIPSEDQFIPLDYLNNIPNHIREQETKTPQNDALLLIDRAIYRPGQEVFFKAILYIDDALKGKVIPNQSVKIVHKDANDQPIDTLNLVTNAFGSVDGRFQIPQKTLNGSFHLEIHQNNRLLAEKYYSVEEYKRPTFKVSFNENKNTYTKQDTARFTGTVETLSGASLSHTSVKYKVSFYDEEHYKQIDYVDSITTTDLNGKFTFNIPLTDPIFHSQKEISLQFYAEAINETGEIQQGYGSYNYADQPLDIAIITPSPIAAEKWENIIVKTTNPNGFPLSAKGILHVYKYDSPTIIQSDRKAFDFKSEYHILDTADYQTYFPHDFDKQDIMTERPKTLVGTFAFESTGIDTVRIDSKHYTYGSYLIEAHSIQGSDTIKASRTIQLFIENSQKTTDKEFLTVQLDRSTYAIGDKVTMDFKTDFEQAGGIYLWKVKGDTKSPVVFLPFKGGHTSYTQSISEEDFQHNTWFEIMMMQENKMVTRRKNIPIIRTDKSLAIQTNTFRDKITPGQKETWSFTIKNKENKTDNIEVLASMYDTALDQFREHTFPSVFPLSRNSYWHQIRSGWSMYNYNHYIPAHNLFSNNWDRQISMRPPSPPTFRNYGLGETNLMFIGGEGTLDEVVVVGYDGDFTDRLESNTSGVAVRGAVSTNSEQQPLYIIDGNIIVDFKQNTLSSDDIHTISVLQSEEAVAIYGADAANGAILIITKEGHKVNQLAQAQTRSNLQETAFFLPDLHTDAEGNIRFTFESPEALTRWKLMLFAHTEDLKAGTSSFFTQTQKQLMVRPNLPRFLREGDEIVIKSQIQNLSTVIQTGTAKLEIINPENNEVISAAFFNDTELRDFSVEAKGNTMVSWKLQIPKDYPIVQIKVVGATEEFSDGEVHELAILPNRILITDSRKIVLESDQSDTFTIPAAAKDNLQAKIQIQSNPILEIISALDYLKNYPYECNEQIASKWYALKMLQYIQSHYPSIHNYFDRINPDKATTKLEENSTLSELVIAEMPWVKQIQNDKDKVKSLARLFKTNFRSEIYTLEQKLQKAQLENGAFSWFSGGKSDTNISIRLLEIFGKVGKLDEALITDDIRNIGRQLIHFLDQDTTVYGTHASTQIALDYLYARSLWNEQPLSTEKIEHLRKHIDLTSSYTADQPAGFAAKAWLVNMQYDYCIASVEVKNRILQEAIYDQERGMYWESNARYYNSMSMQSYMIEAYKQLDSTKLDYIAQWVYYSKQNEHWKTTWNTVDAIYALLLTNNPLDFTLDNNVSIAIDNKPVITDDKVLGQVSKVLTSAELRTDKAINIINNNNRKIYGGIYHQYFVSLKDVRSTQKELSISKKVFVQKGAEWIESTSFKTGDKIKVQLMVVNNEPLHYVHLRDDRAAGFEPVYQSSGYQFWKGYYFTINDASTNYFFDFLPPGRHLYEYEVKTNNSGSFSSGIAQIIGMYNPTVNARSGNISIKIEE